MSEGQSAAEKTACALMGAAHCQKPSLHDPAECGLCGLEGRIAAALQAAEIAERERLLAVVRAKAERWQRQGDAGPWAAAADLIAGAMLDPPAAALPSTPNTEAHHHMLCNRQGQPREGCKQCESFNRTHPATTNTEDAE